METDEIVEKILKPELRKECKRLGIPESFIQGIYWIYPKAWEYTSFCEPVTKDGELEGVRIRLDYRINKAGLALRDFWHEMRHAKDYYNGRKSSEIKANLYSWRRYFERMLCRARRAVVGH